jgi:hypothetical protein
LNGGSCQLPSVTRPVSGNGGAPVIGASLLPGLSCGFGMRPMYGGWAIARSPASCPAISMFLKKKTAESITDAAGVPITFPDP